MAGFAGLFVSAEQCSAKLRHYEALQVAAPAQTFSYLAETAPPLAIFVSPSSRECLFSIPRAARRAGAE
jgi:hypothetical protein